MTKRRNILVVRHSERIECSACSAKVTSSVKVFSKDCPWHFIFCRQCAQRIGAASTLITRGTR